MTEETDTRTILIKAGLEAFAAHGYDGVSVRSLAKAAEANVAAVAYHFGGKEEFYCAVAHHVVAQLKPRLNPLGEYARSVFQRPDFDPRRDREEIAGFVSRFIDAVLGEDIPDGCHAFVMREYAVPGLGFDILYENIISPMHELVTALYARIKGLPPQDPAAIIGAHSLLGQWLFFRVAEQAVIRRLGWSGFNAKNVEQVKAVVVPSVMASLGLPQEDTKLA